MQAFSRSSFEFTKPKQQEDQWINCVYSSDKKIRHLDHLAGLGFFCAHEITD